LFCVAPVNFVVWKLVKRTKFIKPLEADLLWERPTLDAYEATFVDPPTGFWREMLNIVGIGRKKFGQDRRRSSVVVPGVA
jgi:amino acid transporter